MINISELAREFQELSFLEKIRNLRDPDIYLAENIRDYRENAPNLEFPWYKRNIYSPIALDEIAYISIANIKLNKLKEGRIEIPNLFVIHDDSDSDIVYWGNSIPFEEVQGLKDGDWVYDILLRYLIKKDLPSIVEVRKYRFSNRKIEKSSILDKIREFSSDIKVAPEYI